jgi:hypothetical protein
MIETIYAVLLAIVPVITVILSFIGAICKLINNNKKILEPIIQQFEDLRQEVNDKAQSQQAIVQVNMLLEELRLERELTQQLIAELTKKYHKEN